MKRPAFLFYTGDWRKDPCLRRCSAATRGIWIDLLCAMHDLDDGGQIKGTVDQLARLVGEPPEVMAAALSELQSTGTADVTLGHDVVTLISRRFQRESRERKLARERKKKQRSQDVSENVTDPQNEDLSSSSVSSSEKEKTLPHSPAAPGGDSAQADLQLDPAVGRSLKFDFEAVYALYPRKVGRKKGVQRCTSSIKTQAQYDSLVAAVKNYAAKMRGTDEKYVKHFDTFMGCWEDYAAGPPPPSKPKASATASRPATEYVSDYTGWPSGFFESIPNPPELADG